MKKSLVSVLVLALAVCANAITVQPGSNASGDSDATAQTLMYRDASGNSAVNSLTVTTISGGALSPATFALPVATTSQLVLRSDAVGTTFLVKERVASALVSNAYNLCTSTAANIASFVYVAVSTGDASAQGKNGQACAY